MPKLALFYIPMEVFYLSLRRFPWLRIRRLPSSWVCFLLLFPPFLGGLIFLEKLFSSIADCVLIDLRARFFFTLPVFPEGLVDEISINFLRGIWVHFYGNQGLFRTGIERLFGFKCSDSPALVFSGMIEPGCGHHRHSPQLSSSNF